MEKSMFENESPESGKMLNAIPKKELYTAPEGYFNALPAELMSRIQSAPVFHSVEKKELHVAPEGYFEALPQTVISQLQSASTLYSLEKKELFAQPEGYAEQLQSRVMAAVKPAKQAKVVPLSVQVFRWTAVAALLAIMFPISYQLTDDHRVVNQAVKVAELSEADVYEEYLSNETNIDDAISFYVNAASTEASAAETPAEMDYLMDEDIELENF